jgi:excisionase family DNA binding protein
MTTMTEVRAFTLAQVARALQLSPARVRAEVHAGRLRAMRCGRVWRVRREDLEDYLDRLAASPVTVESRAPRSGGARGGRPRQSAG